MIKVSGGRGGSRASYIGKSHDVLSLKVEEYLASYIRVRAEGHVRKLKADRLRQMK
jgi:hypothetical protein